MKEKITVLIADDNKEFANNLVGHLNSDDSMEVIAIAKDGNEAVEMIKNTEPDIVLLDVIMPHLDGLGVLEELSVIELGKKPITIMISAVRARQNNTKGNKFRCRILCCKTI